MWKQRCERMMWPHERREPWLASHRLLLDQTRLEVIALLYPCVCLEDDARKLHFNLLELRTISPPGWFSVHTRIHPKAILGGICINMLTIAWKTLQVYQPSDTCKVLELKKAIKGFERIPVSRQFLMCVTASNSEKSIAPQWESKLQSECTVHVWVGHMVKGDTITRNSNPTPNLVCQPRNCSHEEGWVVYEQLQNVEESNAWLKHPWHLHNTKLHCARARGDLHEGVHRFQPKQRHALPNLQGEIQTKQVWFDRLPLDVQGPQGGVWINMQSDEQLAHTRLIVRVFWWWAGPNYCGLQQTYYHCQVEVAARLGPGQAGVLRSFRVLHVLWGFEIFLSRYVTSFMDSASGIGRKLVPPLIRCAEN